MRRVYADGVSLEENNMKHYSPSSDDSPIDHRHEVRLSDFRRLPAGKYKVSSEESVPPAAFARIENKKGLDALSVIHGSQPSMRSSIQHERDRIRTVVEDVESMPAPGRNIYQSPRRRAPAVPVNSSSARAQLDYEPVDYTSIHGSNNMGNARSYCYMLLRKYT